jgi:hypothetical protein
MKLSSWGKLIAAINDEYVRSQYFIFKTIHENILEEYWRISEREIKHKINLFFRPVHWYEMDTSKPSKRLICDYMLLLSSNYFFASKTSSLD